MHRKALVEPSSAILKHLLENHNCPQMYSVETTFQLCVKEALLIYKHMTTLNKQKEATFYTA